MLAYSAKLQTGSLNSSRAITSVEYAFDTFKVVSIDPVAISLDSPPTHLITVMRSWCNLYFYTNSKSAFSTSMSPAPFPTINLSLFLSYSSAYTYYLDPYWRIVYISGIYHIRTMLSLEVLANLAELTGSI